jgi:hypothetical protein
MKTLATAALLAALTSVPAMAQKLNINLEAVAAKASDKTEMSLSGPLLEMVKTAMSQKTGADHNPFANIDGISLHNYEFEAEGAYSDRDLDGVRKQVTGAAGWTRVLGTKDATDNTEIYVRMEGGKPNGFLLIAEEPKELTVLEISGSAQLAQLQELINSAIKYKDIAE